MPPRLLQRISLPAGRIFFALLVAACCVPPEGHAGTSLQPANQPSAAVPAGERVSKPDLLVVVRDFRDRLGLDPDLYYLVNPPGGMTEEEETEVEDEITHFLSRIHKDPTLDFPSKWLSELKEYELTEAEWAVIERHFRSALGASTLPPSLQQSLHDRFRLLRSQVLSLRESPVS